MGWLLITLVAGQVSWTSYSTKAACERALLTRSPHERAVCAPHTFSTSSRLGAYPR